MKRALFIIILAWIVASTPLFGNRFIPTHDGEFHIIRFWQFYTMVKNGYLFPRWAPDLNSGYGIPLFNFHYPFPNYVGSLFHLLGWNFVDAFKLTLATGYGVAVLGCFLWLKKIFNVSSATIGTAIFMWIPYWFVDIYVRGSVGEVWALAWVMLALTFLEYDNFVLCALSVAGLMISHNILAMLFIPIFFLYSLIRRKKYILVGVGGILISSYFWIPALVERNYVIGLNTVNFRDHFPMISQLLIPSWGTGFSKREFSFDEMSFQIGVIPVIVIIFACILFIRNKPSSYKKLFILFTSIVTVSFLLMLEWSSSIWNRVVPLQLIQYPWRLLSMFIPGVAFFAGWITHRTSKKWTMITVAVFSVIAAFPYTRPVTYEPRSDAYYVSKKEFTDGTSSMGNTFSTRFAQWKEERPKAKIEPIDGDVAIWLNERKPLRYVFQSQGNAPGRVRINTVYYPGWRAWIDAKETFIDYANDGIMHVSIPTGRHAILVQFTETPTRMIGDVVSILSLFCLVALYILKRTYARRNYHQ